MSRVNAPLRVMAWTFVLTYHHGRAERAAGLRRRRDLARRCRLPARSGSRRGRGGVEPAPARMLVLVRRGCFARSANGVVSVLDPTVACFVNPGEEQRYDHPHDNGDDCTAIDLDATLAAAVLGGEPGLPVGAIPISPTLDLAHRALLAQARRGDDRHQLYERAVLLIAAVLESASPGRVASGSPGGPRARHALAAAAREALAERPERTLTELARDLTVSPHHLSRVFSATTGHTIS